MFRYLFFSLFLTAAAHATPQKTVPITVVAVRMPAEEAESWYRTAEMYLPAGLSVLKTVVESEPVSSSKPVLSRYRDALCPRYGSSHSVILVLDKHSGGVIGQANICLKNRLCTLAYVSIDPDRLWESLIAIVHELLHAFGALHTGGCNIMRSGILACPGAFHIKQKTLKQVRECLR